MKILFLFALLAVIIIVSGCTVSVNADSVLKGLSQVKDFIRDHPFSEVKTDFLGSDMSGLPQACLNATTPGQLYRVTVSDRQGNVLKVWYDYAKKGVVCAIQSTINDAASGLNDTKQRTSHASLKCVSYNLYWIDSLGDFEGIKEMCRFGCAEGRCLDEDEATPTPAEKACTADEDCDCGVNKRTGICFYGNRDYVDSNVSRQCPDYCSGITGKMTVQCVGGECKQVDIST